MYENQNFSPVVKQEADGELPINTATDGAQTDAHFPAEEQDASVWSATIEESSVVTQPHMQISPLHVEQFSACRDSDISFSFFADAPKKRADYLCAPSKVEVTMRPVCTSSNLSPSAPGKPFRCESLSPVTQNGAAFASLQPQRAAAGASGLNTDNNLSIRNSLRPKRPNTVWRTSPKLFMCLVCNKNFPRLSQLEEHKSTHQKGFFCPYCGKYFERSGHLERHKRIHTGEKPYLCDVCGKRFNQKCSLKEHTKIHNRCK
uniref:C2H2-type domain-containing protein n=1 Tax=Oryzias melastigma TaxID=30732 RepID=A0A3B3CVT7_ORYME